MTASAGFMAAREGGQGRGESFREEKGAGEFSRRGGSFREAEKRRRVMF